MGLRASAGVLCILTALAPLFITIPGCLNPRPEELPSSADGIAPGAAAATPVRESCGDNPALAGCGVADTNVSDNPAAGGTSSNDSDAPGSSPDEGSPVGFGAESAGDAGTPTDAGVTP
jgi:hypothetical protein